MKQGPELESSNVGAVKSSIESLVFRGEEPVLRK